MLDWLKGTDPSIVISAIGSVALWLWNKARGDKTKTAREVLDDVVLQVINAGDVDLDNVKARVTELGLEALRKLHVTGMPATVLVHEFVEYAAGRLAERLYLHQRRLDALVVGAEAVQKAMTPPVVPTVPVLDLGMEETR